MPLWQYYCATCGDLLEDLRKFADRDKSPRPHCDKCDEETVLDDIQTGGTFRTVGSGWFNSGGY